MWWARCFPINTWILPWGKSFWLQLSPDELVQNLIAQILTTKPPSLLKFPTLQAVKTEMAYGTKASMVHDQTSQNSPPFKFPFSLVFLMLSIQLKVAILLLSCTIFSFIGMIPQNFPTKEIKLKLSKSSKSSKPFQQQLAFFTNDV